MTTEVKGLTPLENLMVGVYKDGTDGLLRGMVAGDVVIEVERSQAVKEVTSEIIEAIRVDGYTTIDGIHKIVEDWHEREVLKGRDE